MSRFALVFLLVTAGHVAAVGQEPNAGYYEGLSILYPYKPVYCDKDSGIGSACYGSPGDLAHLPASAPLPDTEKWCVWSEDFKTWYQWEPREVAPDRRKYLGDRLCYFSDRGMPKNTLKRENDSEPK